MKAFSFTFIDVDTLANEVQLPQVEIADVVRYPAAPSDPRPRPYRRSSSYPLAGGYEAIDPNSSVGG